jgi:DNA (cytosine-5)-methyltransferase 1
MSQLTFGSLFAGIGGFDLGFERAGMRCEWQVEIDPYCQRVLAKHWPNVRRWDDVRTFPPAGDWTVDVICGGFPCQDISNAGKRAGIDGERSGLWAEYARIIRELRPSIVVVENVAALLNRGIERVLGDLAACGYDAEWDCLSASDVGAPHLRRRIFIVANANGEHGRAWRQGRFAGGNSPDAEQTQRQAMGDSHKSGLAFGKGIGCDARKKLAATKRTNGSGDGWWATEPDVVRVANGVPSRVDRIRALGNSIVPQVAEWIGRRIVEAVA